jgi:protein-S-isoprenylcysteine O-methyltransferase Ste14
MLGPLVVLLSLVVFWGVSLVNVLRHRSTGEGATGENPKSPAFTIALLGTLIMFAEALIYVYLELFGSKQVIGQLFTSTFPVMFTGALLFSLGSLLHAWSVVVRGRHAVSWDMPSDHRIILDPPYSLVRHPSYLGYMLMITGLTLMWGNMVTLIPWIAIPGYYFVSIYEESMLIERFGEDYLNYMKQVNGFTPRIGGSRESQKEKR